MPKIDGVRGIQLPNLGFTGRSLKQFKNRRLTSKLSHPDLLGFDGELAYTNNPTVPDLCRTTTSIVNTIDGPDTPVWYIFDLILPSTISLPYDQRYKLLTARVLKLIRESAVWDKTLHVMPGKVIHDVAELQSTLQDYLNLGYEGIVLRKLSGLHKNGRCTQKEGNFLRVKDFATEEAKIVKLLEAEENLNTPKLNELGYEVRSSHKENLVGKGMIGTFVCWSATRGYFNVGPGKMPHADRIKYWNNPELILDKVCTFKYLKTGTITAPRMATFQHFRAEADLL
jgi:hypothetical protein